MIMIRHIEGRRSERIAWLLEELGVPYALDYIAGDVPGSLLALEQQPQAAEHLEACMRAGHSLKGAARIVGLETAVKVAHVMEDCAGYQQIRIEARIMLGQP